MTWSETTTYNFDSLPAPWTTHPAYGTVSIVSGKLRCKQLNSDPTAGWGPAVKNHVSALLLLSDLYDGIDGLITVEVGMSLTGSVWDDHGAGFYQDEDNYIGGGIFSAGGAHTGTARRTHALANTFYYGTATGAGAFAPCYLRAHHNRHASIPFAVTNGDSLGPGEFRFYISRDSGASWTAIEAAMPLAINADYIILHNFVTQPYIPFSNDYLFCSITRTLAVQPRPALRRVLMDLYPPGAYPGGADRAGAPTFHHDILTMDATALGQAEDAAEQLQLEIFPQTAEQTLDEWERALEIDTVATVVAERQALARDAAKSVQLLTPKNLRGMIAELLSPTYGWNDPGDQDRTGIYPYKQNGVGAITEDSSGMLLALTSPAQGDFANQGDPHALVHLVDRADGWTVEVQMAAATVGAGTATGLFISKERYGQGDALFLGLEDVGGGGVAIRAILYTEADGDWAQLGTIATVGPPCWFQVVRSTDGLLQLNAGAALGAMASVVADLELTWTPRVFGLCTRNVSPWNTVDGLYQHLRIAYERQANNVQLYEYDTGQIPADDPERIFWAFVYRDPTEAGGYDLAGAQRIADRVKWGHSLIIAGESNCFLCEDPFSLVERDILGA